MSRFKLSVKPEKYLELSRYALVVLTVIIVTGAIVRLTGSGLGCSDWPACQQSHFVAPLSYHPMIEFGNRMFTGVVSVFVILAAVGSFYRVPRRRDLIWLSMSLIAGVVAQAVVGGLTVRHGLRPPWVMAHFILSMIIAAAAYVLYQRSAWEEGQARVRLSGITELQANLTHFLIVVASIVVFAGTVVTGSGPNGGDPAAKRLGFSLTSTARVHSLFVWCLVILSVYLYINFEKSGVSQSIVQRTRFLILALAGQGVIGYLQYALHLPPGLVIFHIAGAVTVWMAVLRLNFGLYECRPAAEVASMRAVRTNGVASALDGVLHPVN